MSGWLALGLIVLGFAAVAITVLLFDLLRGDLGGGHHTMARARRLLVVATDDPTQAYAEGWIDEQRAERPDLQFFLLVDAEGEPLYSGIQDVLDRERPDGIVFTRHAGEHESHADTLARLREEGTGPIDVIYVTEGQPA